MIPISPELADQLNLLNPQQLAFFGRICLGKKHGRRCGRRVFPITGIRRAARACPPRPHPFRLATGNARKVAEQLLAKLEVRAWMPS